MKVGDMFRSKLSKSKTVDRNARFFYISIKTDYIERIARVAATKADEAVEMIEKSFKEDYPEIENVTFTHLPEYTPEERNLYVPASN
jgi:hypothetical protein